MREFDFLPYEKAIEAMAREYAKVRPIKPIIEDIPDLKEKIPEYNSFLILENIYCFNLEMIMLLRQLRFRITRSELLDQIDQLIDLKTEIAERLESVYHKASDKCHESPAVNRMTIPQILRRLLYIESYIIHNAKQLENDYLDLSGIEQEELKASLILDNIVLIITSL